MGKRSFRVVKLTAEFPQLGYIVYVALGFKALEFGYGIHIYDVSVGDFFDFLRVSVLVHN